MRKKFFLTVTCNVVLCNFSFLYVLSSKLSSYFFLHKSLALILFWLYTQCFPPWLPIRYGLQTHNSGYPLNSFWLISLNLKNLTQDWIWYRLWGLLIQKALELLHWLHATFLWEHVKATPAYFELQHIWAYI